MPIALLSLYKRQCVGLRPRPEVRVRLTIDRALRAQESGANEQGRAAEAVPLPGQGAVALNE